MRFSQVFSAIAASPFQTLQTPFGIGNQIFQFNGKAVLKKVEVLGIRVSPRCFSKSTTANPLQCIAAPLLAISQGSRAAFVPVGEDGDVSLVGFASRNPWLVHTSAWMQSAGTSTSGNAAEGEQRLCEVLGWVVPKSVSPCGQQRPRTQPGTLHPRPAGQQASHARVWPGWNMTPAQRSSSCETSNARVAASAGAHSRMGICTSMCAKSSRESWA